jgi:hypothetical protein
MSALDHIVFSVPVLFSASKNRGWRDTALLKAQVIAEVFAQSGVTRADLAARYQVAPERFEVRQSDLLPDDETFSRQDFHRCFHHWMEKIGRWTTDQTFDKLKASLTQLIHDFRHTSA